MLKRLFSVAAAAVLFLLVNFYAVAQTNVSLDTAIQNASRNIENRLPRGTRLVLVNFASASPALSDYIIEEFTVHLMDSGNLKIIDHNTLNRALVSAEIDLQLSGNVSDETIVSLSKLMGAQYALSGSLTGTGNTLRFEVFLTEAGNQKRQSLGTANVQKNERLTALMNQKAKSEVKISNNPLTSNEFFQRGQKYLDMGEYAKAVADFTESLKFDHISEIEVNYYQLGYAYMSWGKYQEAIPNFSRVIELNGETGAAFYVRGSCYFSIREFDKALADCNRVIQITPNLWKGYILRSSIYCGKGDFDKAIADAQYAVKLQPEHANSYMALAVAYAAKGELDKAAESYRTVVRLGLNDKTTKELKDVLWESYIVRGNASGGRGNHNAAISDFTKAIGIDSSKAIAFANRGMGYFNLGELDKAVADLEQAVKIEPSNAQYKSALERVRRMRDNEAAWGR